MSDRPHVTITLGRSGHVVKRASQSDVSRSDHYPKPGSKRSIRERLGNNLDDPHSYGSKHKDKRQRKEGRSWSSSDGDLEDGKHYMPTHRVSRNDLRYKLINKGLSKKSKSSFGEQNGVDLREKLSRNPHTSFKYDDERRHLPESRGNGFIRRIPPTGSADDFVQLDSSRKAYPCSLDRPRYRSPDRLLGASRHRSPDRLLGASRHMSPRRSYEDMRQDLRHISSIRSVDTSRPSSFLVKSVDVSRPEPFMRKVTVPVEAARSALRAPPPGCSLQKISYTSEESVPNLLHSLGLGRYSILFQAEEVDMTALKQMGDSDLKELGIPMGPRKKILLAMLPRPKHRRS